MPVNGTPYTGGAVGIYSAQTDLEARYGSQNIAAWSAVDGQSTANTQGIQIALTYADTVIQDYFRGSSDNPPPLTPVTTRWAVAIAAESLYHNRSSLPPVPICIVLAVN